MSRAPADVRKVGTHDVVTEDARSQVPAEIEQLVLLIADAVGLYAQKAVVLVQDREGGLVDRDAADAVDPGAALPLIDRVRVVQVELRYRGRSRRRGERDPQARPEGYQNGPRAVVRHHPTSAFRGDRHRYAPSNAQARGPGHSASVSGSAALAAVSA